MQLTDFFDAAVILAANGEQGLRLAARLQASSCRAWVADLSDPCTAAPATRLALAHADDCQSAGVLLLQARQREDRALWSSQDGVLEHLAVRPWDIVYLGHGNCPPQLRNGDRPGLLHCDLPPSDVSAMAVSREVLRALLDVMPDHANDGPLTPAEWMTIACWLAQREVRHATAWAAWPPLAQSPLRH